MTGRYVLRRDRGANVLGEFPICLVYTTHCTSVKKSMGIFVHPDFWLNNEDTHSYVLGGPAGHPKAELYNNVLANKKKEFDKFIERLQENEDFELTVPILRSILNGTYEKEIASSKGKVPFVEEVLRYNQNLYEKGKISYSVWDNIQCNMKNFRKFLQKEKGKDTRSETILYCKDVTVEIIEDYIKWRKERGNKNDTINHCLTPIFKVVKKMMRLDWVKKEVGEEILELYLPTQCKSLVNPTEGDIDYLLPNQVKQLIELADASKYPRTRELMDMFLFSIHCGGMRFSDICTLRWLEINMEQKLIKHLQVKNHTKRPVILSLPLTSESLKILKRWEGRFDNFVFGMLPDEFDLDDAEKLKRTINSRNRTINQSLNCLGEKLGLPFKLHFHIARHTFASTALNKGVDVKIISYLMGHSTSSVTEKVYAKLFPETLVEIAQAKLDFHF